MSGIVGYVGGREAAPILLGALERMEHRGYDSAGVSVQNGRGIVTRKARGRVQGLDRVVRRHPVQGQSGLGHTRWATQGAPSRINAHPHRGCTRELSLVHNGTIENAAGLREMLERSGHRFRTETDSETLVHLIEEMPGRTLQNKVTEALRMVEGWFAIAVMSCREPGQIVAARRGSPVLIGVGEGENFVASDPLAVLDHTRTLVHLEDGDVAVLTADGYRITDLSRSPRERALQVVHQESGAADRGAFPTFMLKEIHDQPASVRATLSGRLQDRKPVRLEGSRLPDDFVARLERVTVLACGTSRHSGLVGRSLIEGLIGIPVRVEHASEYRSQAPLDLRNTLVVAISQSGETADTLEAMRAARAAGGRTLGIVNTEESTIAREADGQIYLRAGPEIGVASTKTFTAQISALVLLALHLAERRGVSVERAARIRSELGRIPGLIREALDLEPQVETVARALSEARSCLYLGRGASYPVALEGALKLKEVSYVHAEGLPAAEMKHGPIALVDPAMPVVFVAPKDAVYQKVISNIQEVRARGGRVVVVSSRGNGDLSGVASHQLRVPATLPELTPLVTVVPLQLLAYHVARLRGCDVDRPRNLGKSVTVE